MIPNCINNSHTSNDKKKGGFEIDDTVEIVNYSINKVLSNNYNSQLTKAVPINDL